MLFKGGESTKIYNVMVNLPMVCVAPGPHGFPQGHMKEQDVKTKWRKGYEKEKCFSWMKIFCLGKYECHESQGSCNF